MSRIRGKDTTPEKRVRSLMHRLGYRLRLHARIGVRELLVASHILPWGKFPAERLNPQNGLCLSRLHDAAFDCGLIAFDDDNRLLVSQELRRHLPQLAIQQNFLAYEGRPFTPPAGVPEPKPDFLRHHRENIFQT